jgi:hypothetical protein
LAILAAFVCYGRAAENSLTTTTQTKTKSQKPLKQTRISVSRETTAILGPLWENGAVDYFAALDQRESRGITGKNNAAILYWQAIGPARVHEAIRGTFFKRLGITPPPDKGNYFISINERAKRLAKVPAGRLGLTDEELDIIARLWEQLEKAEGTKWTRDDFPDLAEWLDINRRQLDLIVEATGRPRYYAPPIYPRSELSDAFLPFFGGLSPMPYSRQVGRAIVCRAMLRLGEGNATSTRIELLAAHRLARLAGGRVTLAGYRIESSACAGDAVLAHSGALSAKQALEFRSELEKMGHMPPLAKKIDREERFEFLNSIYYLEYTRAAYMIGFREKSSKTLWFLSNILVDHFIDWEHVMRTANQFYDRSVEAHRMPTRADRIEAIARIEDELRERTKQHREIGPFIGSLIRHGTCRRTVSEHMSIILLNLLMSGTRMWQNSSDRSAAKFELTRIAFALAAYRSDHKEFPTRLTQLTPKYIAKLPRDPFTDGTFIYKSGRTGYTLYSVGPNECDDNGQTYGQGTNADDIVVRTPSQQE